MDIRKLPIYWCGTHIRYRHKRIEYTLQKIFFFFFFFLILLFYFDVDYCLFEFFNGYLIYLTSFIRTLNNIVLSLNLF